MLKGFRDFVNENLIYNVPAIGDEHSAVHAILKEAKKLGKYKTIRQRRGSYKKVDCGLRDYCYEPLIIYIVLLDGTEVEFDYNYDNKRFELRGDSAVNNFKELQNIFGEARSVYNKKEVYFKLLYFTLLKKENLIAFKYEMIETGDANIIPLDRIKTLEEYHKILIIPYVKDITTERQTKNGTVQFQFLYKNRYDVKGIITTKSGNLRFYDYPSDQGKNFKLDPTNIDDIKKALTSIYDHFVNFIKERDNDLYEIIQSKIKLRSAFDELGISDII